MTPTIICYYFANFGATPVAIVLLSDGSLVQVNTNTLVSTTIAPAGTIVNPSVLNVGFSQYGNQFVIIVSRQDNGYFIWDGTNFYAAGTLTPIVEITANGTNYTTATATATGGSGTGATFAVTINGGLITKITVTNPGHGYVVGDTPTLVITGDGTGATANISIMPFGISGTAVETYVGRVWVVLGPVCNFTAPGSVTDFATGDGGGNFTSSDSFLRVSYIGVIQTNGFLYFIGDSSVNYISGVTVAGSPPTTTFTNQNADPEVGSPWPSTIGTFGRNILFANAFGAHISYGAAVTKISEPLDGVYNTVPNFGGLIPSTAKAIIFGKKVWMLLLPVIDPITGQQVNKLFMWNGKIWWASEQDIDLIFIATQEINSVLTAYGTDGIGIYPLFQVPSVDFTKTVQSKLWDKPGSYFELKTATRLWGLAQYYSLLDPDVMVSIDNEQGFLVNEQTVPLSPATMTWRTADGSLMTWRTGGGDVMTWFVSGMGIVRMAPDAVGQQGTLLGLTAQTNAADMAIISLMLRAEAYAYLG